MWAVGAFCGRCACGEEACGASWREGECRHGLWRHVGLGLALALNLDCLSTAVACGQGGTGINKCCRR